MKSFSGINDLPECQPSTEIIDITVRGPKISKRKDYAKYTSIYSPDSFITGLRNTYPDISTGEDEEFRVFEGRFNTSRAAPDNLAQTAEGDLNVYMGGYKDDQAVTRLFAFNPQDPIIQGLTPTLNKFRETLAMNFGKVILVQPVNQDWTFKDFLKDDQVSDLLIVQVNKGQEEAFQDARNRLEIFARNNRDVLTWNKFIVRNDLIEKNPNGPFYSPADNNEVWINSYPNAEVRNQVFQELATTEPQLAMDLFSTFNCIACVAITKDLDPSYYGPFNYPGFPYFYRNSKPPFISFI